MLEKNSKKNLIFSRKITKNCGWGEKEKEKSMLSTLPRDSLKKR
jgi:hypothetical protein